MDKESPLKTIIFSGGGTGGSATPLLAVAEEILDHNPKSHLVFVGTASGPEKQLVADFGVAGNTLEFVAIAAGKWRRYFSLANLLDPFKIILAFFQSLALLRRYRPQAVISAGSFVSVPLVWAAACLKIPALIHQQDVRPGLANRLMAPWARVISVTFEKSLLDYGSKAVWVGNPVSRQAVANSGDSRRDWGFSPERPLVLITGGSSGSLALNQLISESASRLLEVCQIFHQTGPGKPGLALEPAGYRQAELLSQPEMIRLMAASDLIVSRAGLGTLSALSELAKPSLIIPLPRSHQEDNAALLAQAEAAEVRHQAELSADAFVSIITKLLEDQGRLQELGQNIRRLMRPEAAAKLAGIIEEMIA